MIRNIIVGFVVVAILLSSLTTAAAFGSALSRSDIGRAPEGTCIMYGDEPGWKPICDWINICDDTGEVNSTHEFCTGQAVRNLPYPPDGCPEGFHSNEDDESGLCYPSSEGCEYDNMILTNDKKSCIYDDGCESGYSMGNNCISKEFYCSIEDMNSRYNREYCFSNEDDCNVQLNGSRCDLPAYRGTGLKGVYIAQSQIYCPNYMNNPTLSVYCNGEKGEGGYMYCNLRDELPFHFGIVCVDNPKIN
jgi:hypothetical protein